MTEVTVGVIANPASGRDIRRLVSGASVFDNAEKGSMVYRLMVGLGAAGVERVLMMPAASGVSESLDRNLRGHDEERHLPRLELVEMTVRHDARDTVHAVEKMCERNVSAIAVLGGDGTNRIVARHCGDTPVCTLSTGTNNAFPEMREATVAGLATGLFATGQITDALRREKMLRVELDSGTRQDSALVDVAVSTERFVGARALWRPESVSELFVTSAAPDSVGFSAVAGLLDPVTRDADHGLYVRLADTASAAMKINVPLAPGLVVPISIAGFRRIELGETVEVKPGSGSIALDGERELERNQGDTVEVTLGADGPLTIDVRGIMREAASAGLMNGSG